MLPIRRSNSSYSPTALEAGSRYSSPFDRFFEGDLFAPLKAAAAAAQAQSVVPMAIWEDDNHFYVELDTPGLKEKDVEVTIHNRELVIRGERKCERENHSYDTRAYGAFQQMINLPSTVKTDNIDAKLANGVLTLTFTKGDEAKPRKITLKSE